MTHPVDLSLSLAPRRPPSPEQALADRVRLVLETEPGSLPYMPGFGCALEGLVGRAATTRQVDEVRDRITAALGEWIPGGVVTSCEVAVTRGHAITPASRHDVPTAERALASAGVSASVEARVVLQTVDGLVSIEAQLTP